MADLNSSLPVSGVSMPAWTGIGSALITNAVLSVSGINLAMTGSVAVTSSVALVQTGSVAITSSALIPVSGQGIGIGASGTNADFVWHGLRTGSAAAGVPGLLLTEALGSVAITSSVALTQTGSVAITSSVVLGVSGITLAGSFAITGQPLTITGSVAITQGNWAGVGSVLVSNTVTTSQGTKLGSQLRFTSASVAAGGSAVFYYVPAAAAELHKIKANASGRIKAIWGLGSPTMSDISEEGFSSTANPEVQFDVLQTWAASRALQLVVRNDEGAAMDVYGTVYCTY